MENYDDPNAYMKMKCNNIIAAIENDNFYLFSQLFDNFVPPKNTNYEYLIILSEKRLCNLSKNLEELNNSEWTIYDYLNKLYQLYITKNKIYYQKKISELINENRNVME